MLIDPTKKGIKSNFQINILNYILVKNNITLPNK